MAGCKDLLCDLKPEDGPKVTFGDNAKGSTEGYDVFKAGSVSFKKVAYVSGLKYNLISISQLCDAGYKLRFDK